MKIFKGFTFTLLALLLALSTNGLAQDEQQTQKEEQLSAGEEAAEAETSEEVKEAFAKDKTGTNPLNFTFDARLYDEYRWLNTDGDGSQNLITAEFRMPIAGGKWQVRAKIRRNDLKADFNDDGFGDTDIRS
jgi:hypothetical protein